jgi:hypothetical protein
MLEITVEELVVHIVHSAKETPCADQTNRHLPHYCGGPLLSPYLVLVPSLVLYHHLIDQIDYPVVHDPFRDPGWVIFQMQHQPGRLVG